MDVEKVQHDATFVTERTSEEPSRSTRKDPDHGERLENADRPRTNENITAWMQVLGAFCLNLNTWGIMNAYGVYQTYYALSMLQSSSPSAIAWIGSVQAFLMFLLSFLTGPLLDRGHLRSLLATGTALSVVGFFLTSISSEYWQCFLTQGVAMGLGFGCLYLPAPMLVSMHFKKHRALAVGIASSGSGIGGVIFPLIFTQLEPRLGFGATTRILALILAVSSAVPLAVMRLPQGHANANANPNKKARTTDDASDGGSIRLPRVKQVFQVVADVDALSEWPYMLLNAGLLTGFMGLYIILYYVNLFALSQTDAPHSIASNALIILNAASTLGRIAPSAVADVIGPMNVLAIVVLVGAVLVFSLLAVAHTSGLIAWAIVFGVVGGSFTGLPAVGVVSASTSASRLGSRLGMTLAAVGVGVLIAEPIAGAILDGMSGWRGLVGWCGGLMMASALLLVWARLAKTGVRAKAVA